MIVVIQCAAKKQPDAGSLRTRDGRRVFFVADPDHAPELTDVVFARPDDTSDEGYSWREKLLEYNADAAFNPLGLCQAYELYHNPAYQLLVDRFGLKRVFILSAGWGLISAAFLTPYYDITFSVTKDAYKRRKKSDQYHDFCQLPEGVEDELYFFGGKGYMPMFCKLTESYKGERTVFFNSKTEPTVPGCILKRFYTRTRTNWHYECVREFCEGRL